MKLISELKWKSKLLVQLSDGIKLLNCFQIVQQSEWLLSLKPGLYLKNALNNSLSNTSSSVLLKQLDES